LEAKPAYRREARARVASENLFASLAFSPSWSRTTTGWWTRWGRGMVTLQTCTMPYFENRLIVRADRVDRA
jgi:hypothetical protein